MCEWKQSVKLATAYGIGVVLGVAFCCSAAVGDEMDMPTSKIVYENKIQGNITDAWSKKNMDWTPGKERMFLGRFGSEKVKLTLEDLPEHKFIRVTFDLILVRSWDGSSPTWGPDFWNLSVDGGQQLIHTTFTNCGFFKVNNQQAFPDDYEADPPQDWRDHAGFTGAREKQTLGYIDFGDESTDSVYRMRLVFPHSADTLKLCFAGDYKDRWDDQSWALDEITVEAVSGPTPMSEKAMQVCWEALGGDDPIEAFGAIWKMVGSGEQAVEFIQKASDLKAPTPDTLHHSRTLRVLRLIDSEQAGVLRKRIGSSETNGE